MDREKVIKALETCRKTDCANCEYSTEVCLIDEILSDALALLKEQEEIRHGEWKWRHGGECSECGYHNSNFDYKYCPMCGAMMDT